MDFENIRKATENFSDKKVIGHGGFGTVYKAEISRTPMAIKVLKDVSANLSSILGTICHHFSHSKILLLQYKDTIANS